MIRSSFLCNVVNGNCIHFVAVAVRTHVSTKHTRMNCIYRWVLIIGHNLNAFIIDHAFVYTFTDNSNYLTAWRVFFSYFCCIQIKVKKYTLIVSSSNMSCVLCTPHKWSEDCPMHTPDRQYCFEHSQFTSIKASLLDKFQLLCEH